MISSTKWSVTQKTLWICWLELLYFFKSENKLLELFICLGKFKSGYDSHTLESITNLCLSSLSVPDMLISPWLCRSYKILFFIENQKFTEKFWTKTQICFPSYLFSYAMRLRLKSFSHENSEYKVSNFCYILFYIQKTLFFVGFPLTFEQPTIFEVNSLFKPTYK